MNLKNGMTLSIAMGLTLSLVLALGATSASAKPPLRDVAQVDDGLLAVAVADEIRENCDDASARMMRAMNFLRDLQQTARSLGYTDDEIDAYRKSDSEKARMRARRDAYLSANGVTRGNPETYCTLGRAEIQRSSQIGALLRMR